MEKDDSSRRIEGRQNGRMQPYLEGTEGRDCEEPKNDDRSEDRTQLRGPFALKHEEPRQDDERYRNDEVFECGRGHLEALDRREHADRWRDDPLADEQASARMSSERRAPRPRRL